MKKLIGIFLVIMLCLSVFCPVANAEEKTQYGGTIYYIDPTNGNNLNDGKSPKSAWKSFFTIKVNKLNPGDAVLFKRGETFLTTGITINVSGTKDKPITFSCYGDESLPLPLIIARDIDAMNGVVFISNQSYIHVDSLHIKSLYSGTDSMAGIRLQSAGGNTIYGNKITNCVIDGENRDWESSRANKFTGIAVAAKDYWGFFDGVTIENNQIYNCKAIGISVNGCHGGCDKDGNVSETSGKNIVVRNNFLYNIGKDGILMNNCNAPLVEYNTCGKSHSYAKTSWHVAMWPFACYKALFQYNEAYDTKTTYDGQGFDCDYLCYYTTFQYNYSHDNEGGFMLICTEPQATWLSDPTAYNIGAVVRYNISQNDKHHIFGFTCHITDTKIYNNTIYADKGVDSIVSVYSRNNVNMPINTQFYNNIFYTNSGNFKWLKSTGTQFKNNIVYGKNAFRYPKNDTDETTSDGIESSGNIYADPLLVNPGYAGMGRESCFVYKLRECSPALKAGLIIDDESNTLDFFGNAVSKDVNPNIGAYNGDAINFEAGDTDFDGEVKVNDMLILRKYLSKDIDENFVNKEYADFNGDGNADLIDYLLLRRKFAQI